MFKAIERWLKRKSANKSVVFPTKTGVVASTCVSLLDLHGSLFCLDNQNILFREDGKAKVLKPTHVTVAELKHENFDAFETAYGFAIRYNGLDYHYEAKYEVLHGLNGQIYIRIKDTTSAYNTKEVDSSLVTLDGSEV